MEENIINLFETVIVLAISTLFAFGSITLNIAFFALLVISGLIFGSLGTFSGIVNENSSPLIPFFGMIIFIALGFFCKVYVPALYFSEFIKH